MSTSKGSLGRIGEYDLIEEIGQGGIGTVYRATDRRDGSSVAVKQIKPALSLDPRMVSALTRAARQSQKLSPARVIATLEIGMDRPPVYLTMAYAPGGSLAGLLAGEPAPLTPRRAAELLAPVALSLDQAHEAGILHGGIKPSNLLFSAEGRLMPADFGYARAVRAIDRRWRLVDARYAAPEEAEGGGGATDARADLYGLGMVLYEMLTRHTPFDGADAEAVLAQARTGTPAPPRRYRPDLSEAVEQVVLKAISRNPSSRYGTAGEMVAALNRAAAKLPSRRSATDSADLTSPWTPPTPRPPARHPWRSALAGLCLLAFLGYGTWMFAKSKPTTSGPVNKDYYNTLLSDIEHGKPLPTIKEINGRLTVKNYQDLVLRAQQHQSKATLQKLDENEVLARNESKQRIQELQDEIRRLQREMQHEMDQAKQGMIAALNHKVHQEEQKVAQLGQHAQEFAQLYTQVLKGEAEAPSDSELADRGYNPWEIEQIHQAAEFHASHSPPP